MTFLLCNTGSLVVGLCIQGCKSLCVAVMVYATLVSIQTDRYTHSQTAFDQLI